VDDDNAVDDIDVRRAVDIDDDDDDVVDNERALTNRGT
jgi:hypothetical protein